MSMTFEQPKHLNVVSYQRDVRALQPVLLVSGVEQSPVSWFQLGAGWLALPSDL
jgi:hypothetical protein